MAREKLFDTRYVVARRSTGREEGKEGERGRIKRGRERRWEGDGIKGREEGMR